MKCPVCYDELQNLNGDIKNHLITCKDSLGHIHVHGDFHNRVVIQEMMTTVTQHTGISPVQKALERKEIVFHNRQRIGDILMFTCGVRDFKAAYPDVKVNVISTAMHIWDNNPYLDKSIKPTEENTIKIGPGKLTNSSNRIDWHFANAYRVSIEDALSVTIPQGESRPDIWFTRDEYNAPRTFNDPYWLIVLTGEKSWGCKMYPFDRWQEFIDQNKDTLFIQLGAQGDNPPRLKGENVIDMVGKTEDKNTGIRDLFKLFLNAEGSIGLVSFHMHLSGALYKPAIVVAGAREPVSFTRYQGHQYLANDGCLPCAATSACWHCDINKCTNLIRVKDEDIPHCVNMIHPEDLTRALNQYYVGGRLTKGRPSEKPKLKNIVERPINIHSYYEPNEKVIMSKFNIPFGRTCISKVDWDFIEKTIDEYKVKTILEFGSGLSTLLMKDKGLQVVSYDTHKKWMDRIKDYEEKYNIKADIRYWDGKNLEDKTHYDMAFVDGPVGGVNREHSIRIAGELADIVIIHDATRPEEKMWQEMHIIGKFEGPKKGGVCALWLKKMNKTVQHKFIKIVSTARGWGGCARSITTIMKMLIKEGHKIEFIPFRNTIGSHEFRECMGQSDMTNIQIAGSYDSIKEPCDILFVYADDFVWEFGKPEIVDAFTNIKADKKIMMLNYRRGSIGELDWTKGWDKYMFLNSTQEKELLAILPGIKTKVLPPCTDLTNFFEAKPNFNKNLHIVRHSSQGDTKFALNFKDEVDAILVINEAIEISMMPGPSFIEPSKRFMKWQRNSMPIFNFLGMGNLFWYSLPYGYMDMGPRVILEAMAAGLPILADNWGGAKDRVTSECGWLCTTKDDHIDIIKNVTMKELEEKGKASRERARNEFDAKNWIKEVLC